MEEPRLSTDVNLRNPSRSHVSDFNFDVSNILADYFSKKLDGNLQQGDADEQKYHQSESNFREEDPRNSDRRKKKYRKKRGRRDYDSSDDTSLRHREKRSRYERERNFRDYRNNDDRRHSSHQGRPGGDRHREHIFDRSRNVPRDSSGSLQTASDEPLGVNKTELFETARRNVKQMLHDGTVPKGFNVNPVDTQPRLSVYKEEATDSAEKYTEMCRRIRKEDETEPPRSQLNHPFAVKDKPIKMNIANSVSLAIQTSKEKILSAQFPVSSGSTHRELEWQPVRPDTPTRKAELFQNSKRLLQNYDSMYPERQDVGRSNLFDRRKYFDSDARQFPRSQRNEFPRNVQDHHHHHPHPSDVEAKENPKYNDSSLNDHVFNSPSPGQLTNCVDPNVRFLSANELRHGPQAWTRKDQLKNTKALSGGIGMTLLQKMGWKPGTALGKNREGVLEPLLVDVKFDRRGLVAQEELIRKPPMSAQNSTANRSASETAAIQKVIDNKFGGKHPVTLILELCTARKLHPPRFIDLPPEGEPHDRTFLCRVEFNGKVFIPKERSLTKKLAKAQAALLALAALRENDHNLKHW